MPAGLKYLACEAVKGRKHLRPTGRRARPLSASAHAKFAATVDLPTPPLPDATAMMRLMPGIFSGPAAAPLRWFSCVCSSMFGPAAAGGVSLCAVNMTATFRPSATALMRFSAAVRTASISAAYDGSTESTNRMPSSSMTRVSMMFAATISLPDAGSTTSLSAE